jgi:hypothetical protein
MGESWEHRHLSDVPQADDCVPDMFQWARLDFPGRGHLDPYPDKGEGVNLVLGDARLGL